jgi:hypothetical protein
LTKTDRLEPREDQSIPKHKNNITTTMSDKINNGNKINSSINLINLDDFVECEECGIKGSCDKFWPSGRLINLTYWCDEHKVLSDSWINGTCAECLELGCVGDFLKCEKCGDFHCCAECSEEHYCDEWEEEKEEMEAKRKGEIKKMWAQKKKTGEDGEYFDEVCACCSINMLSNGKKLTAIEFNDLCENDAGWDGDGQWLCEECRQDDDGEDGE